MKTGSKYNHQFPTFCYYYNEGIMEAKHDAIMWYIIEIIKYQRREKIPTKEDTPKKRANHPKFPSCITAEFSKQSNSKTRATLLIFKQKLRPRIKPSSTWFWATLGSCSSQIQASRDKHFDFHNKYIHI